MSVRAVLDRRGATETVADDAAPLLLGAENLYVALAAADAAASTAFLQTGLEPPELRASYLDDIRQAGEQLAGLAARSDLPPTARRAVTTIAAELPVYSGWVESARTNSRLGHPLGAAYLRRASDLMGSTILPAATAVYEEAARHLAAGQRSGTSPAAVVAILVGGGVVGVSLLLTQLYLLWRTRRVVNVGLAAATVVVIGLCVVAVVLLDSQRRSLSTSQREGSDPLVMLSTARILALRSLSDENLDLIERGTEPAHMEDFDDVTAGAGELLERASQAADASPGVRSIIGRYDDYLAVHGQVRQLAGDGAFDAAEAVAVSELATAAGAPRRGVDQRDRGSHRRPRPQAGEARDTLRWLPMVIGVAMLAALALAVVGLQPRMREYR